MNLAELFTRACDERGPAYRPYDFEGTWYENEEDLRIVRAAIAPHVPKAVDAMFNNWCFYKWGRGVGSYYTARRFTWEIMWGTGSAQELADKIKKYYKL